MRRGRLSTGYFQFNSLRLVGCLLIVLIGSSIGTFSPPVYEIAVIPTGTPEFWGPYQMFYDASTNTVMVAELMTASFCSIKNGNRVYFAGGGGTYSKPKALAEGPATSAVFAAAYGVWGDTQNNVYLVDRGNLIKKVTNGRVATVAGNTEAGSTGDGGPATSATVNAPSFIYGDANGNIFFGEYSGKRIRKVSKNNIISTVAGGGSNVGYGFAATSSSIPETVSPFVNSDGDIFFTAAGSLILMVSNTDKKLSLLTGGGNTAPATNGVPALEVLLISPAGMWGDNKGNIFFTEQHGHRVQMLSKETNYQTTYLLASGLDSTLSMYGDNNTGKLYVLQGSSAPKGGRVISMTDPLFGVAPSTVAPSPSSVSPSSAPSAKPTAVPSVTPSSSPSTSPSATPSSTPSEAPTLAVPEYSLTISAKSFKYFEVRVFTEANERVFPVRYDLVDCPENAGAVIWGHESTPITEDTNTCVYGLPRHYWCECPALVNGNKPKLTLNFGGTVFDRVELLILDWVDGEVTVSDSANNIVLFSALRAGGPLAGEEFVGYDHLNLLQIAPSVVPTVTPSSVPTTKPSWTPTTKPTIPSIVPTQTPTVVPTTTKPSAEPSVTPSIVPSAAPSFTAAYTITLTAKTFKYFEVRVYTHDNLRIFPVSYELEHCPENAGVAVWNDQTTEDTNTCVYGYPRNFWCECAAVADAKPKLVLHMGHTVFDRVELLLLNWEDGEVTVTDEANHETFLSATHDGVGNEFVTFGNLNLEHAAAAPVRRLLRGA